MLKTIKVEQVTLGMHIHSFEGPWMDHPFWRTKFTLNSEKDLQKLRKSNTKLVTIDVSKGKDVETAQEIEAQQEAEAPREMVAEKTILDDIIVPEGDFCDIAEHFEHELETQQPDTPEQVPASPQARVAAHEEHEKAKQAISAAKKAVSSMFHDVRMGKAIDSDSLENVVDDVTASIERNETALISLARLKSKDDYTYMHSVAVCGLMIALAKQLEMNDAEIKQAGMAGLMHDIGKARVPLAILNKPGKLTDEEYKTVQQHAQHGYEMLLEANVNDPVALDVCLHHHEKYDGTGYPKQLAADDISVFARMGAICDVYDAITSNRPYKPGWEPAVSLQRMAQWHGHFDEVIFKAFVKSLGIYPIGSTIRLSSERLAVVIDQNKESLLSPVVRVFYCLRKKTMLAIEDIDLLNAEEKIVGLEDPKAWGFDSIDDIWNKNDAMTA